MEIDFKESFKNDLKKVEDKSILGRIREVAKEVENPQNIQTIRQIKRLKGNASYYRIRIGDYRVGIKLQNNIVIFVRFIHRRDFYRYFP